MIGTKPFVIVGIIAASIDLVLAGTAAATTVLPAAAGFPWLPVGLTLAALPLIARAASRIMRTPLPEIERMAGILTEIGYSARLDHVNTHLGSLTEESWRHLYPDAAAAWTYFRPIWEREHLRCRLIPEIRGRIEALRQAAG